MQGKQHNNSMNNVAECLTIRVHSWRMDMRSNSQIAKSSATFRNVTTGVLSSLCLFLVKSFVPYCSDGYLRWLMLHCPKNKLDFTVGTHALNRYSYCATLSSSTLNSSTHCQSASSISRRHLTVHTESPWNFTRMYDIPQWYVSISKSIYLNSSCRMKPDTGITEYFTIVTCIFQGCILSPLLFILAVDFIVWNAVRGPSIGIKGKEQIWLKDLNLLCWQKQKVNFWR